MISFSGIDCSGKSTQIERVSRKLDKNGIRYKVVWSRGGYTPGIVFMKRLIRGRKRGSESREERTAYSERVAECPRLRLLLFTASLIDLWFYYSVTLRLRGKCGTMIVCDRYIWDTYIDFKLKYPDIDFENGFWWRLTLWTMLKPKPSFLLTIPAELSTYRSTLKDEPFPEPIEARKERLSLYTREESNGRWQHSIDATGTIEEVSEMIAGRLL